MFNLQEKRERKELQALYNRLQGYVGEAKNRREELCARVIRTVFNTSTKGIIEARAWRFCQAMIDTEGYLYPPAITINQPLSTSEVWKYTEEIKRTLVQFEDKGQTDTFTEVLAFILYTLTDGLPPIKASSDEWASLSVPLYALLPDARLAIDKVFSLFNFEPTSRIDSYVCNRFLEQLFYNVQIASNMDVDQPVKNRNSFVFPRQTDIPLEDVVLTYFGGTPLVEFLLTPVPFSIPLNSRFEHMHVVGGSGHGKTQLLQHLILHDLDELKEGRGSIIVIDSQGDMIRNILQLADFCEGGLYDRLVLIDPNDIEHPPALNLFDFGLDRLTSYSPVEREKLTNGAIALYEYLFGALLGAELSLRQGVIFRYLARLMMTVPGATIHTLMGFMEDPETTRPYLSRLDPLTRRFFETQFYSKKFNDTREQILTRLWGVVSNSVLERMFASERNKVDLFAAMNRGSIILVNTAKDLLKQEGCEILGRFFIALICQATQERAAILKNQRRPTFVYIDEAHDYFDESLENLFNQARKYEVGLIIAHQNLDQFDTKLRATVTSSTAIKTVGGLSSKDAGYFAKEMQCEPEFLMSMRKRQAHTEFACHVRNFTPQPIRLTVPFGDMERRPRLPDLLYEALLERNRHRYSMGYSEEDREEHDARRDDVFTQPKGLPGGTPKDDDGLGGYEPI
jgi:hypothetical protein